MATVQSIVNLARVSIGDVKRKTTESDDVLIWDDDSLAALATVAVGNMNDRWIQQFTVSGNTLTDTYSPDPADSNDTEAVALFMAREALSVERTKWSRRAISHSNAAGSTNMREVADAIGKQLDYVNAEIERIELFKQSDSIADDMVARELRTELSASSVSHTREL
jgi:hypothetical protein